MSWRLRKSVIAWPICAFERGAGWGDGEVVDAVAGRGGDACAVPVPCDARAEELLSRNIAIGIDLRKTPTLRTRTTGLG